MPRTNRTPTADPATIAMTANPLFRPKDGSVQLDTNAYVACGATDPYETITQPATYALFLSGGSAGESFSDATANGDTPASRSPILPLRSPNSDAAWTPRMPATRAQRGDGAWGVSPDDNDPDQPKTWRARLCNRYTALLVVAVGAVGAYVGVSQAGGGGAGSPDNSVAGPGLGGSNPGTTLAVATSTLTTFLQTLAPTAATAPPTFAPVAAAAPTPPPIFSIAPTSPRAPTGSLAPTTLSPTGFNVTYSPTGVPTITPTHFPSFAPSGVPTFPPTSQPTTSTTITATTPTTRTLTTITATNTTVTATSITSTTTGTVTSITTTLLSGGTTLRIDFTPAFNSLTGAQQNSLCRGLFGPPGFNQCNTAASAGSKCCNVNTGWGCSNTCNN